MTLVVEIAERHLGPDSGQGTAQVALTPAQEKFLIPVDELPLASDDALVRSALAGQQDGFGELVRRYTNMVLCYINARVRNQLEAEEITQEALVRAYTQLANLRAPRAFANWVLSIANAVMIDRRRADSKTVPLEDSGDELAPGPSLTPPDLVSEAETRTGVFRQMERLPVHYRVALALKYINGFSVEEIAVKLQVPEGTVRARLSRAYRLLRKKLEAAAAGATVDDDAEGASADGASSE